MIKHLPVIVVLHAAMGAFQLLMAGLVGLMFSGLGGMLFAMGGASGEDDMMIVGGIYGVAGLLAAAIAALMTVPSFAAAWGLYKRRPWGRIVGMVVSALDCMSFPLGTIVGVYSLVVLLDSEVAAAFSGDG